MISPYKVERFESVRFDVGKLNEQSEFGSEKTFGRIGRIKTELQLHSAKKEIQYDSSGLDH